MSTLDRAGRSTLVTLRDLASDRVRRAEAALADAQRQVDRSRKALALLDAELERRRVEAVA